MAEQQPYTVVREESEWELRSYPPHVIAETTVTGVSFEDAGNRAFGRLVGYIKGDNVSRQSIAMTAPVVQTGGDDEGFVVAFVLPAEIKEADAPVPTDSRVTIRTVPERLVAATTFSGRWTEESYASHRDDLFAHVREAGLEPIGEPQFARFDAPFIPWFLRRNEVLIDVAPAG
ncbi:SOUL family heme-binding protein [Microbacterium aurantiacum]|uniref:Heme-binding protein n=1 Tax=Microbacterium aurantiacum TaxID=162393 RepID=A0A0M9VL81_9MICO|nr:heme-binding protein [Microbacterium chocolatum]ANG86221.1 heme-binding protein [Microbacterium chocolatum]KOS10875.1 heme-binding protein [Microbacterium chocolatum]